MIISFTCYQNYFYFLIYWILELFTSISRNSIYKIKNLKIGLNANLMDEYIDLICFNIADLLAGFLALYTKCSSSKKG